MTGIRTAYADPRLTVPTALDREMGLLLHPVYRLSRGARVFIDAYGSGLVPAIVTTVDDAGNVTVRVTADRRAYRRGEILTYDRDAAAVPGNGTIVPRSAVRSSAGAYVIRGWTVTPIPDALLFCTGCAGHYRPFAGGVVHMSAACRGPVV